MTTKIPTAGGLLAMTLLTKEKLDKILARCDVKARISFDPVQFVHRYTDPEDQEVVAFLASSLAYGNVVQILKNVDILLGLLVSGKDDGPARAVDRFEPKKNGGRFSRFVHRFHNPSAVMDLLGRLKKVRDDYGTLEAFFLEGWEQGTGMRGALASFSRRLRALSPKIERFTFLYPSPESGSACKRMNLFLRWMVRPSDGVDLGLWKSLSPSRLIIPLDTHIGRIAHQLGLTKKTSGTWRTAEEITESLRRFDPEDPVRYDFALCHLGISGAFAC